MEKPCKKLNQEMVTDPFLILVNNSHCMQEILLKIRYFDRGLTKSHKKVNFIFSFKPSPF